MSGGKSEVLIGIGSNIDPYSNIEKAVLHIKRYMPITRISSFYLSKPYGFSDQDDFLNGCILVESVVSPEELKFNILKKIEQSIGRVRTINRNSPRTIDLDILLFGNIVMEKKGIRIPDPEMFVRDYILCPAREIAGQMLNPVSGKTVSDYTLDMKGLTPVSFDPSL